MRRDVSRGRKSKAGGGIKSKAAQLYTPLPTLLQEPLLRVVKGLLPFRSSVISLVSRNVLTLSHTFTLISLTHLLALLILTRAIFSNSLALFPLAYNASVCIKRLFLYDRNETKRFLYK